MFPGSAPCPAPGSRQSDTGTEDSGISVSFEQGGGASLNVPSPATAVSTDSAGGGGDCAGDGSGPMESFPSPQTEPNSAFQIVSSGVHTESATAECGSAPHVREVQPLTTLSQCNPIQLPIFIPADSVHQRVSDHKVVGARQCIGLRPLSIRPSTTLDGSGAEIGKEGSPVWTSVPSYGYGVVPASGGSSQQQLSPQLQQRELVLWPTSENPPLSSKPTITGVGVGAKSDPLYGLFIKTPDGTRWQCKECKRLFSSQGSLRAHARIHTGERPYQCQYCGRSFCQASTLRSHERLHTGEKPYKCEHCGRAFTQSAGLRSHLKTHRYDSQ